MFLVNGSNKENRIGFGRWLTRLRIKEGGDGLEEPEQWQGFFIEQLQSERHDFFEQVASANRKVGELENRLLQLGTSNEKPDA